MTFKEFLNEGVKIGQEVTVIKVTRPQPGKKITSDFISFIKSKVTSVINRTVKVENIIGSFSTKTGGFSGNTYGESMACVFKTLSSPEKKQMENGVENLIKEIDHANKYEIDDKALNVISTKLNN